MEYPHKLKMRFFSDQVSKLKNTVLCTEKSSKRSDSFVFSLDMVYEKSKFMIIAHI